MNVHGTPGLAQQVRFWITDQGRVALGQTAGSCGICTGPVASIEQHLAEHHPTVYARVIGRAS